MPPRPTTATASESTAISRASTTARSGARWTSGDGPARQTQRLPSLLDDEAGRDEVADEPADAAAGEAGALAELGARQRSRRRAAPAPARLRLARRMLSLRCPLSLPIVPDHRPPSPPERRLTEFVPRGRKLVDAHTSRLPPSVSSTRASMAARVGALGSRGSIRSCGGSRAVPAVAIIVAAAGRWMRRRRPPRGGDRRAALRRRRRRHRPPLRGRLPVLRRRWRGGVRLRRRRPQRAVLRRRQRAGSAVPQREPGGWGAGSSPELPSAVTDLTAVTGAYPLDIDSDGRTDLVVLRVGQDVILRGLGDCRFERADEALGVRRRRHVDRRVQRDVGGHRTAADAGLRRLPRAGSQLVRGRSAGAARPPTGDEYRAADRADAELLHAVDAVQRLEPVRPARPAR